MLLPKSKQYCCTWEFFYLFSLCFAVALKFSATFLPTLLSSPPSILLRVFGPSHCLQILVAKKPACPVFPLFFCSFFCSKSSVIHVFTVYDASPQNRGELWFVWKHTVHFYRLNNAEVSTPNWCKCLLGCLGGFLVQELFEFESWSNPECALRPLTVASVGDTIYNFPMACQIFLLLFFFIPTHLYPFVISSHSGFPPFPYEFRGFFLISVSFPCSQHSVCFFWSWKVWKYKILRESNECDPCDFSSVESKYERQMKP